MTRSTLGRLGIVGILLPDQSTAPACCYIHVYYIHVLVSSPRSVHGASAWYHDHLAGQKPIIIISQDPQMKTVYGSKQIGVHVYSLEEYLKAFWPDLLSARDLLESLTASIDDAVGKGSGSYLALRCFMLILVIA